MIAEFISNYGDVGALTILVGVMVWYLKYQTKRQAEREDKQDEERTKRQEKRDKEQKEERDYYRNLITNDMKGLHKTSVENAKLNRDSLAILKTLTNQFTGLTEYMNSHFKVNSKKKIKK